MGIFAFDRKLFAVLRSFVRYRTVFIWIKRYFSNARKITSRFYEDSSAALRAGLVRRQGRETEFGEPNEAFSDAVCGQEIKTKAELIF